MTRRLGTIGLMSAMLALLVGMSDARGVEIREAIDAVQPKMVKVYGAGGPRGLEAYQSGFLISPDGHILTVFSYVLDTPSLSVTLADGERHEAEVVGADPRAEIAVLKIDVADAPYFDVADAVEAREGARVLAVSNLFGLAYGDEPCSVLHGVVSARTTLDARRGAYDAPYDGPVYVLDAAANNPGAAGGALVSHEGRLLGLLGKELQDANYGTWLNYALPIVDLRETIADVRAGRSSRIDAPSDRKPRNAWTLDALGLVLVPDVLRRTPPYIDQVREGSPGAAAGLSPDDLIVLVDDRLIQSSDDFRDAISYVDALEMLRITVLRGGELVEATVTPP